MMQRNVFGDLCGNRIFTAMEPNTIMGLSGMELLRAGFAAMVAILFLQSGLSKVFGWKGEMEWLTGHFAKSPLKGTMPVLLPVITVLELAAGTCAAVGFVQALVGAERSIGAWGMLLGLVSIVLLFFGQRVAKDYAGAASLVPYFLLCALGVWVFMG
jgi:uncharacterized membrane protein YphA (DoxX/SURF4 family)